MTEELYTLYYDLMVNFPFSITGYEDIESKISLYFERFCNHPFNKLNKDISLIVGIFGQLSGLDELNADKIDKINDWETKKVEKFWFCNYEGDRSALVMSFYVHQLQSLFESERYAINVLTENFRNDIDFRISLYEDEKPNYFFRRNERIFEIKIPKSIYRDEIFKNPSETRNVLREKLQQHLVGIDKNNLIVKHDFEYKYELEIIDEINKDRAEIYGNLSKEIYAKTFEEFYGSNKDYLLSEFGTGLVKNLFKNEKIEIEELFKIAYVGSFLCAYYGVNLEYILSTCRVVEIGKRQKKYGLGGIAVGVKNDGDFTLSNRAFYKIISNQIASNLSGQITYDLFSSEIYKERAWFHLTEFCKRDGSLWTLTHRLAKNSDELKKLKNKVKDELESLRLKEIISERTYLNAIAIIEKITFESHKTKSEKPELEKMFVLKLKELVSSFEDKFRVSKNDIVVSDKLKDSNSYYFDFEWLINLLIEIPHSNFKKHAVPKDGKLKIEISAISINKNDEECTNKNNTPHYLRIRMIDTGDGMELPESIKNSESSYSSLHRGKPDYKVLKTHGNIFVRSKGKKNSILDLDNESELKNSDETKSNKGTIFEVLLMAKNHENNRN